MTHSIGLAKRAPHSYRFVVWTLLCLALYTTGCEPGTGGGVTCACSDPACTMEACDPTCSSGCAGGRCDQYTDLCTVCGNGVCDVGEKPSSCPEDCPATDRLDLLFVIDNSGSMAEGQYALSAQFAELLQELYTTGADVPDLHIGVVSTDLGSGANDLYLCGTNGGDDGRLLVPQYCAGPTDASHLVDVAPRGCDEAMAADGSCGAHDCDDTHCAHSPGTILLQAPRSGCPRCRNFTGDLVDDVFPCMASLGTMGCGYEQSLEAMRKALDNHPDNVGFLREGSVLAVVILTDEDDCSASDPALFDDSDTSLTSTMGPMSLRCFEWGTTCDVDSRAAGLRHNCVPRDDPGALLYPVDRYVDFLRSLRDPGRVVVAAVTGPVTASAEGNGFDVTIEDEQPLNPAPEYSCSSPSSGAIPATRVHAMVSRFHQVEDVPGLFGNICTFGNSQVLPLIGARIQSALR